MRDMLFFYSTPVFLAKVLQKNPLKPIATAVLVTSLAFGLTACHKGVTSVQHEPAKLVQITAGQNVLTNVFSSNISGANKSKKLATSLGNVHFSRKKHEVEKQQTVTTLNIVNDAQGYVVAVPNGTVTALDKQGKKQWQITIKKGIAAGVAAPMSADGSSNIVVISDNNAHLIAFDRQTGQQRWQANMTSNVLSPCLIANNRVISLSNDGVVSGLSLETGAQIWQFVTQKPDISVRGAATPIMLDSQNVLVATADGRIHAINMDNGVPLWSRRIGIAQGASEVDRLTDIDATPVLSDNMLYVITYSGQLVGIDMAGRQINFLQNYASLKSVAADSQKLYVTTLSGEVLALDKFTGKQAWKSDALSYRGLSNPVVVKNHLVVGDGDGYLHVMDTATGSIIDRKQMRNDVSNLTLSHGNQLIAQSQMGNFSVWQVN